METSIIMLYEKDKFGPIPDDITGIQTFGAERIVDASGNTIARGDSMFISASEEVLKDWLKGHDVWQSHSPMLGDWFVTHIKEDSRLKPERC